MARKKRISIIIPCYNEEATIVSTIKKIDFYLNLKKYEYEIIVIDDGSSDKTVEKLTKLMKSLKHLFFVSHFPNKGKGFAVRNGLILSKYQTKLILDADMSVSIVHLSRISLKSKGYYIIKGQRVQTIKQPFYRILVGKIWQILVFLRTGMFFDTQCPFSLLKLPDKFYKSLKIDGFAFDVEILYKAKGLGFPIKKVNVVYENKPDSKVTLRKTIAMFFELLKIRKSFCSKKKEIKKGY